MKPKPWSAMSAEERDALVASKVMGMDCRSWADIYSVDHYTTSIAAAFEVVQRMRELKDCRCQIEERHTEWRVSFVGCANDDREHYAYAKTLPEAICLAALRAHGVEVGDL